MVLTNSRRCDRGNRTLHWSQFCDGIVDCIDRSDEEGQFCKRCINNLYSCPPKDDIRCDLACQMLHYVPCQTIQDRRACDKILKVEDHSLFENFKFYMGEKDGYLSKSSSFGILVAVILLLVVLIGMFCLIKYLQQRFINSTAKSSEIVDDNCPHPIETDTLSSHLYEQCDEPPSYKFATKYPYYEHVV